METVTFGPLACACTRTRGPLGRDVGPAARGVAQLIADGVLEAQRAETRVRDLRMFAGEIAGQRARRIDVRAPVDGARGLVEARVGRRVENCATTRNTRLPTRDSRQARYATSSDPVNSTPSARSRTSPAPKLAQLRGQQVTEAARARRHETLRWRVQVQVSSMRDDGARGKGSSCVRRATGACRMRYASMSKSRSTRRRVRASSSATRRLRRRHRTSPGAASRR